MFAYCFEMDERGQNGREKIKEDRTRIEGLEGRMDNREHDEHNNFPPRKMISFH